MFSASAPFLEQETLFLNMRWRRDVEVIIAITKIDAIAISEL